MLRYIFVLTLFVTCEITAIASTIQPQVRYEYDAAGNRVSRYLYQQRSQSPSLQQAHTFIVYPTVVTDVINVTTQDEITPDSFSYSVTNVSGNIVLSGVIQSQSTQIQVSLLQGYYILNIFSATEQYSFNFLKN